MILQKLIFRSVNSATTLQGNYSWMGGNYKKKKIVFVSHSSFPINFYSLRFNNIILDFEEIKTGFSFYLQSITIFLIVWQIYTKSGVYFYSYCNIIYIKYNEELKDYFTHELSPFPMSLFNPVSLRVMIRRLL